jgi:hypothetical protein
LKVREFIICNTALSTNVGEHWFVILKTCKNYLEIFDSLGVDENKEHRILSFVNYNVKKVTFNKQQFQSNQSDSCGKFCIFFVVQRLYNLDLKFREFLEEMFHSDLTENEQMIQKFCNTLLETDDIESEK